MTTPEQGLTKIQAKQKEFRDHLTGFHVSLGLHYGAKLGLFEALMELGPCSSRDLAGHTGLNERWLREWLHQQASAGILEHERGETFWLLAETKALLDPENRAFFPMHMLPSLVQGWSHFPEGLRTGVGQSYDDTLGEEGWAMDRVTPRSRVVAEEGIPAIQGMAERLENGACAADVGCGNGIGTLLFAETFPGSFWSGLDNSGIGIQRARERAASRDSLNVTFHHLDDQSLPSDHSLDLVTIVDVVHDLTFPDRLLESVHRALRPDGAALIVEIAQPDSLDEKLEHPGAPTMFSYSIALCMSSGLCEEGGAGLGTFGLHESLLREMATEAGFTRFRRTEVTDIVNAYYELRP